MSQAAERHPHRRRDRHQPVGGVPQVPAATSTPLYCNLVEAGEAAGILETLLDRLAIYKEKTLAIKGKIKSALIYPIAVLVVAFVVIAVIMIFVIPAFKEVFKSLRRRPAGADAVRDRDVASSSSSTGG